jgi:hypothetical protein
MAEIRGRATRGSRLQMQIAVNRRADELAAALRGAFPELRERDAALDWRSPLAPEYEELRDEAFLRAVGLERLAGELRRFWPLRGPVWDGLAVIEFLSGPPGVLLAEAKSHPEEFYSRGWQAKAPASRELIRRSIAETQRWLGVQARPERWIEPVRRHQPGSSLYQSANRFAHLYFLRELAGVDAWLVHVLFVDDTTHVATSLERWRRALAQMEAELGLSHARVPWSGHVFLAASPPHERP